MNPIEYIRKHLQKILLVIMICMCTSQIGCPFNKSEIEDALNDAIYALSVNSAEWQNIMNQLIGQLGGMDDAIADIIRNEVQNLLDRGVAVIGSEFRCNYDFIGNRQREALIRLKNQFFGTNDPVGPLVPYVCETVPSIVDRILIPDRLSVVEYFGYDFDLLCRKLYLEKLDGTRRDITYSLDMLTHYHMTVNLSLIDFTSQDVRFVLTCDSEVISSIGIKQDSTKEENVYPGTIKYVPPHTRGDREFNGHGPDVWCKVSLETLNDDTQLRVKIWMKAKETTSDWTTAEGTDYQTIYTAHSGKQIKQILTVTEDYIYYYDDDTSDDYFPRGDAGLVNKYIFKGDTSGDDAGTDTSVTVIFNKVVFLVGFIGSEPGYFGDYELVILEPEEDGFVAYTYEVDEDEVAEMIEEYEAEMDELEEENADLGDDLYDENYEEYELENDELVDD